MRNPPLSLADGLRLSGMSDEELWSRYFALGGLDTQEEVLRHIRNDDVADGHEFNMIAQSLNESFLDRGWDHPVGYWLDAGIDG